MYTIHTTPGFITASRPRGEADKLLSIFTRDFGLLTVAARGIRLGKSKLRAYSQDYSFGEFSFVRGKEFWRLTDARGLHASAAPSARQFAKRAFPPAGEGERDEGLAERSYRADGAALELVARMASLLKRLLHGEEAHPELFDCILACEEFLAESGDNIAEERLTTLESLTAARMLHRLGYIGYDPGLNGYLRSTDVARGLLDELKDKKAVLNKHINKALKESHL